MEPGDQATFAGPLAVDSIPSRRSAPPGSYRCGDHHSDVANHSGRTGRSGRPDAPVLVCERSPTNHAKEELDRAALAHPDRLQVRYIVNSAGPTGGDGVGQTAASPSPTFRWCVLGSHRCGRAAKRWSSESIPYSSADQNRWFASCVARWRAMAVSMSDLSQERRRRRPNRMGKPHARRRMHMLENEVAYWPCWDIDQSRSRGSDSAPARTHLRRP